MSTWCRPSPATSSSVVMTGCVARSRRTCPASRVAPVSTPSPTYADSCCGCEDRQLPPLVATRPHLELYLRWMQEVRRFNPSTVSRRWSVVSGFDRPCVIDGVLDQSPADHVRRPNVPPESPTLGLTHLRFEALLTAGRESRNDNDLALVALFGLLGRIDRATVDAAPGRSCGHAAVPGWTATSRPAASTGSPRPPGCGSRGCTPTCCATPSPPPCSTPALTSATSRSPPATPDPRTTMRYDRARQNLDRHPNYILAAYMASGT
jgi:integrase/recombinase XerD